MDKARSDKECGIEGVAPEPIFVPVVVLGHPVTELIRGSPNTDKDLLVLHGNVLHGQDGLGPEPANHEVHLVLRDQPLHGIGGVRDVEEFIGICLNKLDFHLFLADLNAPFGIDLLGGHGCPIPMAFALHKLHRSDDADLNAPVQRQP